MAAGNITLYSKNKDDLRLNDIIVATVKLALVTSSYTPDATVTGNSLWSDASANEIANGNGYTTGGYSLASMVATAITGGFKFSSASPIWTASGGSIPVWRYGVLYVSGTLWGMTNPLIGYFLGDTTPADIPVTTVGNTLSITAPAAGWFDAT